MSFGGSSYVALAACTNVTPGADATKWSLVAQGLSEPLSGRSLFDVGHQDGVDFLVMEYLEGETLAERIN